MAILSKLAKVEVSNIAEYDEALWKLTFGYADLDIVNGEHTLLIILWSSILGHNCYMSQLVLKYMKR